MARNKDPKREKIIYIKYPNKENDSDQCTDSNQDTALPKYQHSTSQTFRAGIG
jgi:hypothetical protein